MYTSVIAMTANGDRKAISATCSFVVLRGEVVNLLALLIRKT